jgi:hypothetical protein
MKTLLTSGRGLAQRWHTTTVFGLIALAFLLPFATVSCGNASTTFTGEQLVIHTVPHGGTVDQSGCGDLSHCVEQKGSTTATVALFAAVVGLLLAAFGVTKGPGWCAGVGLAATLSLAWEGFQPFGPTVTFRSGYLLTLLLFLWSSAIHTRRAWRRRGGARQPRLQRQQD